MSLSRRSFIGMATGGAVASALPMASFASQAHRAGIKAVAFDAFPIFDPRPIAAVAEALRPGQGQAWMNAWRKSQFEYQWLRALSGQYVDFLQATRDGLMFAARQLHLEISPEEQARLMAAWSNLQVWPDASEAARVLHDMGLRLALLSNMTAQALNNGLKQAQIDGMFEAVISTDAIRSYKPDPRAYQLGVDTLRLQKEEILFVAFAGWDVAGAKWFGYPTFWLNRMNSPQEALGVEADATGPDLAALVDFVSARKAA